MQCLIAIKFLVWCFSFHYNKDSRLISLKLKLDYTEIDMLKITLHVISVPLTIFDLCRIFTFSRVIIGVLLRLLCEKSPHSSITDV